MSTTLRSYSTLSIQIRGAALDPSLAPNLWFCFLRNCNPLRMLIRLSKPSLSFGSRFEMRQLYLSEVLDLSCRLADRWTLMAANLQATFLELNSGATSRVLGCSHCLRVLRISHFRLSKLWQRADLSWLRTQRVSESLLRVLGRERSWWRMTRAH